MIEETNYLESERVPTLLRKFALPCIFSLIISCLYNIVDQIFVGNGIGYLGNAATGVIFPITVIGWAISLLFGDGAAAALSVLSGEGRKEKLDKVVANAIIGSFFFGLVLIVICYSLGDKLLKFIGATEANLKLCHDYGYIIYALIPLALVQNTLASIIRADGSPLYAMNAMLVGAAINIIGDPIAIFVLDLGIKGAAIATILGQFVSFLICIFYLRKPKTFSINAKSFLIDKKVFLKISALGSSSFLTQISIVIITIINNILLVKYGMLSEFGPDIPLASITVIMKLFQIVINIAIGIAAGAQPIVGYNYGARRMDRVQEVLKLMTVWIIIISLIAFVLFEAVPGIFINLFGTEGDLYFRFATFALRVFLSGIILTSMQKAYSIFLQSMGRAKEAAPLSILRDLFLIVFSLTLPILFGLNGILIAAPIADILSFAITIIVLKKVLISIKNEKIEIEKAE